MRSGGVITVFYRITEVLTDKGRQDLMAPTAKASPRRPFPDPSPLSEAGVRALQFCQLVGCRKSKRVCRLTFCIVIPSEARDLGFASSQQLEAGSFLLLHSSVCRGVFPCPASFLLFLLSLLSPSLLSRRPNIPSPSKT